MVYDKDITIIGKALLHNTLSISLISYCFLDVYYDRRTLCMTAVVQSSLLRKAFDFLMKNNSLYSIKHDRNACYAPCKWVYSICK